MRSAVRVVPILLACTLAACFEPHRDDANPGPSGVETASASGSAASSTGGSSGSSSSTGMGATSCASLVADFCALAQACQQLDANCAEVIAGDGGFDCPAGCARDLAATECDIAMQAATANGDCSLLVGGGSPHAAACTQALGGAFIFQASVSEGGSCWTAGDCLSRPDGGAVVCTSDGVCPGVCTAGALGEPCGSGCLEGYCSSAGTCQPFLAEGASCTDTWGGCDPSTDFCTYDADGGATCQHQLAAGSACESIRSGGCEVGTYCIPAGDGGLACEPAAQLGQPCVKDCGWSNCATGFCSNGTCQASSIDPGLGQPPPGLGQPCGAGSLCDPALTCLGGICQGPPVAGQPCSSNFGLACRTGDYCDNEGVCQMMKALGEACDTTAHMPVCLDGRCDATGHCAPLLPPGAPCDFHVFECSTYYRGCAIDSTPSGGAVWYCYDAACTQPADGGSGTFCAASCAP